LPKKGKKAEHMVKYLY